VDPGLGTPGPIGSVTEYAPGAAGNAAPIVTISGAGTGLSGPADVTLDPAGDLFVANANGSVTEYAKGADGDVAPIAAISGAATGLETPQGRRVRYVTTAALVNELVEAADDRVLSRAVSRYGRLDLLLLDELGYVQADPRGAELLFQVITERQERASIAIGTNLPFSEWGTVFPDPLLVAAIVDRVTFNAHILETGTQSYRLRTTKTASRSKNPS